VGVEAATNEWEVLQRLALFAASNAWPASDGLCQAWCERRGYRVMHGGESVYLVEGGKRHMKKATGKKMMAHRMSEDPADGVQSVALQAASLQSERNE